MQGAAGPLHISWIKGALLAFGQGSMVYSRYAMESPHLGVPSVPPLRQQCGAKPIPVSNQCRWCAECLPKSHCVAQSETLSRTKLISGGRSAAVTMTAACRLADALLTQLHMPQHPQFCRISSAQSHLVERPGLIHPLRAQLCTEELTGSRTMLWAQIQCTTARRHRSLFNRVQFNRVQCNSMPTT